MNSISGFLQKFLNLERNNNVKLSVILDAIKSETGIELKKEDIQIKGERLKINCNPVIRNEIFMRRDNIEGILKSQKIFLKLI